MTDHLVEVALHAAVIEAIVPWMVLMGMAAPVKMVLGIGVGVMATALLGWSASRMAAQDRLRHGPTRRQVSAALGLSRSQQRTLESIARRAGLPGAVSMLMSRGCFEWAVATAAPPQARFELAAIRRRVFDS